LSTNPLISAFLIDNPELIPLFPENSVQAVPDPAIGLEFRDGGITRFTARDIENITETQLLPTWVAANRFAQKRKETEAGQQPEGSPIRIYYRGDTPGAVSNPPGLP
jgi:hypothetical protein